MFLGTEAHPDLGFLREAEVQVQGPQESEVPASEVSESVPGCSHIRCLAAGVGSAAPPWGEAGIVFSTAGVEKSQTPSRVNRGLGPQPWEPPGGGGSGGQGTEAVAWPGLALEPGTCQHSSRGPKGGPRRCEVQGVPRGHPVSQSQGQGQH